MNFDLADPAAMHALERERLVELLDLIGPAVIVCIRLAVRGSGRPPTRAPNSRFPIAVVTGEASMFVRFDRHLVAFLEQAGCEVELIRLADHGVHGNSHRDHARAQPRAGAGGPHRVGGAR